MKLPSGFKRFIKRAKIPIRVQGEKKPRMIYTIPEVLQAAQLMQEMVIALQTFSDACYKGYGRDIQPIDKVLQKFKEWK